MASSFLLVALRARTLALLVFAITFIFSSPATAQFDPVTEESTTTTTTDSVTTTASTSTSSTSATTTALTQVVQVFFIDERSYEGLPYTMLHRDSGSVLGIASNLTTFVITTTRADQRPPPAHTRTDNVTTGIPTLASTRKLGKGNSTTGAPSTITQGPATFMFTGTRFGPDHTLVNRCSLNGTASAICNLTHVGSAWYTKETAWNGTFSTYSYTWTSGDRFGFAPVTITAGAEMLLAGGVSPTASGSANAASRQSDGGCGSVALVVWVVAMAVGVGVML
ncbi:hypothetical protein QBC47DRAFT_433671 [Echria macrotheca]|uniref:Uncharacterized protein n=1 Tax=Echria macrotheca TaxID=438768 RepID=A0AAJ0B6K2_9PEZI|nr:hypothetical protein QBC47DRAFT_433671 [Echria macrotheca]